LTEGKLQLILVVSLGIDEGTQRKEANKVLQGVDSNYSSD
jgi:hypothetical protein